MDPTLNSSFLPLPPDETVEAFRVEGTLAVRALVRELINARALVTLYAHDDPDVFIVTRIVGLEADTLELDCGGDEERLRALREATYLTAVGVAGAVKIQFRLQDVDIAQVASLPGRSAVATLAAAVPSEGWRVQRRNAFRVRPPLSDQALVALRIAGSGEIKGQLTDLSVGGLAASWTAAGQEPAPGVTLRHCRIEADGITPIPCDLRVVRVDRAAEGEPAVVSYEFEAMPQIVARHVQLYVMDIEKRARLVRRES